MKKHIQEWVTTDNHMSINRIDNDKGYSHENCRWASWTEQSRNRRLPKTKKKTHFSKYRGVIKRFAHRFAARIRIGYRLKFIGAFDTPEEAACAYNSAALKCFGPTAILNSVRMPSTAPRR